MNAYLKIILIMLLFTPQVARAWNFDEHTLLGRAAYIRACTILKDKHAGTRPFEMACPVQPGEPQDYWTIAERYGRGVALAGDHVDDIDEFFAAAGLSKTSSYYHYGLSAMLNFLHFQPQSLQEWRKRHNQALELAAVQFNQEARARSKKNGGPPDGYMSIRQSFERAFFLAAFGDHFLQDSFAAGHMGFNRPGSTMGEARTFHQVFNKKGRLVRDQQGDTWQTFGDGEIIGKCEEKEKCQCHLKTDCYEKVQAAANASVLDFLSAFMTGSRNYRREQLTQSLMPAMLSLQTGADSPGEYGPFYSSEAVYKKAQNNFIPFGMWMNTSNNLEVYAGGFSWLFVDGFEYPVMRIHAAVGTVWSDSTPRRWDTGYDIVEEPAALIIRPGPTQRAPEEKPTQIANTYQALVLHDALKNGEDFYYLDSSTTPWLLIRNRGSRLVGRGQGAGPPVFDMALDITLDVSDNGILTQQVSFGYMSFGSGSRQADLPYVAYVLGIDLYNFVVNLRLGKSAGRDFLAPEAFFSVGVGYRCECTSTGGGPLEL